MRRCLRLLRSTWRSSSRLIGRRSMRLVTIARYDRSRELISARSSSTKPSRWNMRCSQIARDRSTEGDSSTATASTTSTLGEAAMTWRVGSTGVGGAVSRHAACAALMRAAVLSFFLFALPLSVRLCFLLRALPRCRRWCARQPNGQRRFCRPAFRGCVKKRIPQWQQGTAQFSKSGRSRKTASSAS